VFQNPPRFIAQPLATRRKPSAHLNPFGFSPTHIADTKNQKSLNLSQRTKKENNEITDLKQINLTKKDRL